MHQPLQPGHHEPDAEPAASAGDPVEPTPPADDSPPAAADTGEPAPQPPAPDAPEPPLRQLDPRWVAAERISGAIGALVLLIGALVALLIFGAGWRLAGLGAWAIFAAALVTAAMAAPAIQYRRARYRVTTFGLEIHWGVLWRRITIVPRSRIQHTDVEQGPLLRRFGLAKLVVHTAGTEHSTVPLYGLAMPDATAIRDDLMGRTSGAGASGASDGI